MKKKNYFSSIIIFFLFFFTIKTEASFQEKLLNKYKTINTLSFNFTQKIGNKTEFGNCYIKYPLLMKCEYPKKKKSIIANGKKLVIVKRRYKKIYNYSLKKTPLYFLLKKENILNLIIDYEPIKVDTNMVKYDAVDNNSNLLEIFFNIDSLNLLGWKTVDPYSNEVIFLIRNVKQNILIDNKIFKIPKEENF